MCPSPRLGLAEGREYSTGFKARIPGIRKWCPRWHSHDWPPHWAAMNMVELRADAHLRSRRGQHRLSAGTTAGAPGSYGMVLRPRSGERAALSWPEKTL